jgi:hypothetical protein
MLPLPTGNVKVSVVYMDSYFISAHPLLPNYHYPNHQPKREAQPLAPQQPYNPAIHHRRSIRVKRHCNQKTLLRQIYKSRFPNQRMARATQPIR